jgi:hypothetical protein
MANGSKLRILDAAVEDCEMDTAYPFTDAASENPFRVKYPELAFICAGYNYINHLTKKIGLHCARYERRTQTRDQMPLSAHVNWQLNPSTYFLPKNSVARADQGTGYY